jgi:sugar/nucleoside kinase (ribokinase family)
LNIAIIVTLGEKGVVWGDKRTRKVSYVPCKKVKVVDTTVSYY